MHQILMGFVEKIKGCFFDAAQDINSKYNCCIKEKEKCYGYVFWPRWSLTNVLLISSEDY